MRYLQNVFQLIKCTAGLAVAKKS